MAAQERDSKENTKRRTGVRFPRCLLQGFEVTVFGFLYVALPSYASYILVANIIAGVITQYQRGSFGIK